MIQFTPDELKSIISLLFAIQYHEHDDKEKNKEVMKFILNEKHTIVNTTRQFGRLVLENLEDFKLEYLKSILVKQYYLNEILTNNDILEFTDTVLLDYMPLRSFEYGKLFLRKFTTEVVNENEYNLNQQKIYNILKKEQQPFKKIGEQLIKANEYSFSLQENMLLAFTLKEKLIDTRCSSLEYGLISKIAKQKIVDLVRNLAIYKKVLSKTYSLNWNLANGKNKGRGGPKL